MRLTQVFGREWRRDYLETDKSDRMRLIHVETLKLEEFFDEETPPYAILSHRWSKEEISYEGYLRGDAMDSVGYRKVVDFCSYVRRRNDAWNMAKAKISIGTPFVECHLDEETLRGSANQTVLWIWVDTCCIDKKSSAELSEAVNSMYEWYSKSEYCVVHLPNIDCTTDCSSLDQLASSEWWYRGWTLQELIVPQSLIFVDWNWHTVGHKCTGTVTTSRYAWHARLKDSHGAFGRCLNDKISEITTIQKLYLDDSRWLADASIARKMSWAARRATTRIEDQAYCLIGLFRINMPLLYGERERAFERLQHEIVRLYDDESIFAWWDTSQGPNPSKDRGLFATAPSAFAGCGDVERDLLQTEPSEFTLTNRGMEINCVLWALTLAFAETNLDGTVTERYFALRLNCIFRRDRRDVPVYIFFRELKTGLGKMLRIGTNMDPVAAYNFLLRLSGGSLGRQTFLAARNADDIRLEVKRETDLLNRILKEPGQDRALVMRGLIQYEYRGMMGETDTIAETLP